MLLSAAMLLWPALWNGYPLVFDDTGTYLSQAVHHYVGWDRPPFYSLFLYPLHLTITTWPDIAAQALLAIYTLHLLCRVLLPALSGSALVLLVAWLSATTALPWLASQLMPDIFTPLLILSLALLLFAADRLSPSERRWLAALSAFMIAAQQSSVALAGVLLLVLAPLRRWLGASGRCGVRGRVLLAAPPVMAMAALILLNAAVFGRPLPFPYGNVFLLARVIYDGPGRDALHRDCPQSGWRLCQFLSNFPATSDQFLWSPASPVMLAGGHKRVSAEANAIILAALRTEFRTEVVAWLRNGLVQLAQFDTGDELRPCPATVTPWIEQDFPRVEQSVYAEARQTNGGISVPAWLQAVHRTMAFAGVVGCGVVLVLGIRTRHRAAGFAAATLVAIAANSFIAGGLSTPHHRYGSRVILLAPTVAILAGVSLRIAQTQQAAVARQDHAGAEPSGGAA